MEFMVEAVENNRIKTLCVRLVTPAAGVPDEA
jgi:hypothetical protein